MAAPQPIADPVIAGITGTPDLNRPDGRGARALAFTGTLTNPVDGGIVAVDVKRLILDSWAYILDKCAKHKACNECFAKLPAGKTLEAVLREGNIVICQLAPPLPNPVRPSPRKTDSDMALAITAGRQIAVNPAVLFAAASNQAQLTATLVHEIAHIAGASTNPDDPVHALDAENTLKSCLFPQMFDPNALGLLGHGSRRLTA